MDRKVNGAALQTWTSDIARSQELAVSLFIPPGFLQCLAFRITGA